MTSISERVDKLVGKVGNMESKVNNMESKVNNIDHTEQLTAEKVSKMEDRVEEIAQDGAEMKKRMDSMDTKMTSVSNKVDKVDQDVKMISYTQGWSYLGRGYILGTDQESGQGSGTTLSQCCQVCESKHSADHQWNGFLWDPSNGCCNCEKNDQGNDPTRATYYMHFFKQ